MIKNTYKKSTLSLACMLAGIATMPFTGCAAVHFTDRDKPKPAPVVAVKPAAPVVAAAAATALPTPSPEEMAARAATREKEMQNKMQAAVEEIAQLYGNPRFIQTFSNDPELANEFRARLSSAREISTIKAEVAALTQKRDDVLNDIAVREKEIKRLTERMARTRSALDNVAGAVDQARRSMEESAPGAVAPVNP